jgi:UDP-glucose 4-epimerase
MIHDNTTVTVFGGSGFLGGHVSDQLSKSGYKVRIFDKHKSPWLSNDQEMIIGDLLDEQAVREAIQGSDIAYNFAAISDLNVSMRKPKKTMQVNVLGNVNVLESCRECGVERFIYASTVYVNSREGGFYRISKQASEQLVEEYHQLYGLEYTILRYGSIYGPRSDEHNGLFRIVRDAIKNGVVRYEGHPESLREYVHVEDVARASVVVLGKEFCNENIVLTGQEGMRVYDILKMLAEIMGIPDKVEFIEAQYKGHYVRTPYSYEQKIGRKYIQSLHVDLGQGLLQLINEVQEKTKKL